METLSGLRQAASSAKRRGVLIVEAVRMGRGTDQAPAVAPSSLPLAERWADRDGSHSLLGADLVSRSSLAGEP